MKNVSTPVPKPDRVLPQRTRLVQQVYDAVFTEITEGKLPPNSRLIQEELADAYGVSRQPVQQALLLLRSHGIVSDAPGRGLLVLPLEVGFVRHLYEVRAVLEGLAARLAAGNSAGISMADGASLMTAGRAAVRSHSVAQQIAADLAFHRFLYDASGNPLIQETTAPHWNHMQRVMGDVLRGDDAMPGIIWDEHAAILEAVLAGHADAAETLARCHITHAADVFIDRMQSHTVSLQTFMGSTETV